MRSRGLVVAIAVVLALLAAAGVIVYTSNLEQQVTTENTTQVFVSSQNIDANTILDPLIDQGVFRPVNIPNDAVVVDPVISVDQLRGQTTAAQIFANEQIPLSRLASAGSANALGITEGNVGLGLSIQGPAAVNGAITQGASVVVYATVPRGTPVTDDDLQKLLSPQQLQSFYESVGGGAPTSGNNGVFVLPADVTVTLLPTAKVLAVQNPPIDTTTGRKSGGETTLALDLLPEDASLVVFASAKTQLYLGLLPPENAEDGYDTEGTVGVPLSKVVGVGQ